jgi:hypothetical protein
LKENFDRFNLNFTRRSRMVDFRRWILALAVLALFTGLASAQVGTGVGNNPQFTCATNVSAVPQLRAEGLTEVTGDIVITCTGGNPVQPGTQIPTVNISVFLNTNVTSRLFSTAPNVSEALLMIDEPGSTSPAPIPGFGPAAPQSVCPTPASGCTEFATDIGAEPGFPAGFTVATNTNNGAAVTPGATAGFNVFQGVVNPDGIHPQLVTFFGIPVLAPASTGTSRVFRITNIRANASVFSGTVAGTQQLIAQITVSNPSALPITNSVPVVGFVQRGLNTTTAGTLAGRQCTTTTKQFISTLNFTEGFATAFKTRVAAQSNSLGAGQIAPSNQNVPGSIYNSESNFVLPVTGGTAGLADFGTRLKATFHNVPTNISLFVSATNVVNSTTALAAPPSPIGGSAGNNTSTSFAVLVSGETTPDGTGGTTPATSTSTTFGNIPVIQVPVDATGTATAVWEVVNTNPASLDTLTFAVFTTFAGNTVPAPTAVTANLSFAPTPPAISLTSGVLAGGSALPIPRFADLSAASTVLNISICRTVLLYPFVTNAPGFDTGIAISNTSTDPFGTGPQSGACTLNFFSGPTNPPPITTASIASGTVFPLVMSNTSGLQGFTGYMIATCNFQYAHGFAFISDLGTRNFAMGYLALVIPDPSSGRNADPLSTAPASSGENIAH